MQTVSALSRLSRSPQGQAEEPPEALRIAGVTELQLPRTTTPGGSSAEGARFIKSLLGTGGCLVPRPPAETFNEGGSGRRYCRAVGVVVVLVLLLLPLLS